jgi:hypothetical protein
MRFLASTTQLRGAATVLGNVHFLLGALVDTNGLSLAKKVNSRSLQLVHSCVAEALRVTERTSRLVATGIRVALNENRHPVPVMAGTNI